MAEEFPASLGILWKRLASVLREVLLSKHGQLIQERLRVIQVIQAFIGLHAYAHDVRVDNGNLGQTVIVTES